MKGGLGFAERKSYLYHEALWESHSLETEVGVEPLPACPWGGRGRAAVSGKRRGACRAR